MLREMETKTIIKFVNSGYRIMIMNGVWHRYIDYENYTNHEEQYTNINFFLLLRNNLELITDSKIIFFLRKSSQTDDNESSFELQYNLCAKELEERNIGEDLIPDAIFILKGDVWGKKNDPYRTALNELKKILRNGHGTEIFVSNADKLTRNIDIFDKVSEWVSKTKSIIISSDMDLSLIHI